MRVWAKIVLLFLALAVLSLGVLSIREYQLPGAFTGAPETPSPSDWVKSGDIKVYQNKVVLDIPNAIWASFTDTNSMDPVFDSDAHALEIVPENPAAIAIGDIISYKSAYGILVHRVVETGLDEEGYYYIVQGDNAPFRDPGKVRFENVKGVVVAVIY